MANTSNDHPDESEESSDRKDIKINADSDDIMFLPSMPSTREKQSKQVGDEMLGPQNPLKFKWHSVPQVMGFVLMVIL